MNRVQLIILQSLCVVALTAPAAAALASDQVGLKVELTPYLWAAGVDGSISVGQQTAHFNKSFSDLVDNVESAFMVLGVVSYDRFVLYADHDYMSLEGQSNLLPNGDRVKGELDLDINTFAGGYRFDTFGQDNTIDVLLGSRNLTLDAKIRHTGITNLSVSNNWDVTDTIVMLRPSFQISQRWRFNPIVVRHIGRLGHDVRAVAASSVGFLGRVRVACRLQEAPLSAKEWPEEHAEFS